METANILILIIISFLGGVISSISPCTIALLPLILAYICGTSNNSYKELALKLLSFSVGLSTIMSILGLFCAVSGKVLGSFASPVLLIIFGSVLMALGLQLTGIIDIPLPTVVKKIPKSESTSLFWYPFLIGVLFAFLASPCSTPILVAIMAFATASTKYATAFLMLFAFALGQCIIIVFAGLFASFLKNLQKIQKYTGTLIKISGVILIIFALFIWTSIYINIVK
ncbi:MAG: cytochrome c biogenesis CcdA family protein [Candidatus Gastranaerophilaceae bacterium]